MNIKKNISIKTTQNAKIWNKNNIIWIFSLYGTAIGAGVLFLPINAGIGGLLPLIIIAIIAFPMTFFAHQGLMRFTLSGDIECKDITDVVKKHFGKRVGNLITIIYFFSIYPVILLYSVAITNTVENFIIFQLNYTLLPRPLLALLITIGVTIIISFKKDTIIKIMTLLVCPFIAILIFLSFYLIPYWNNAIFQLPLIQTQINNHNNLLNTLCLVIPVMIFSFNHSAIISSFAISKRKEYGDDAEFKCSHILMYCHAIMVLTVMFFVFSCVLSLSPENMYEAKKQNISILSYLANHFNNPFIASIGPIVAFIAILKSFLGHYLGASEGFNGLVTTVLNLWNKKISDDKMNKIASIFIAITSWITATLNPNILGFIEVLSGPIIALLLFLMPMYAISKVPSLSCYRGKKSNYFVWLIGITALTTMLYKFIITNL